MMHGQKNIKLRWIYVSYESIKQRLFPSAVLPY